MIRSIRLALTLLPLIVCMLAPAPARAQVLEGRVVDAVDDAALDDVYVSVLTTQGDTVTTNLAASDGIYMFRVDATGVFQVHLTRAGYRTAVLESVSVPDRSVVDLGVTALIPEPGAQGPPTGELRMLGFAASDRDRGRVPIPTDRS